MKANSTCVTRFSAIIWVFGKFHMDLAVIQEAQGSVIISQAVSPDHRKSHFTLPKI